MRPQHPIPSGYYGNGHPPWMDKVALPASYHVEDQIWRHISAQVRDLVFWDVVLPLAWKIASDASDTKIDKISS
jgi:hypothetical protein